MFDVSTYTRQVSSSSPRNGLRVFEGHEGRLTTGQYRLIQTDKRLKYICLSI